MKTYTKEDCIKDTKEHIQKVKNNIHTITTNLEKRAEVHDQSKIEQPELDIFVEYTPKLANTTYGSEEYKGHLKGMRKGLEHHYKVNPHHPEHYDNGINGMCLLDLTEMLSDWKAATERHADGDIIKSLEINKERFGISDQLYEILLNTIEGLRW